MCAFRPLPRDGHPAFRLLSWGHPTPVWLAASLSWAGAALGAYAAVLLFGTTSFLFLQGPRSCLLSWAPLPLLSAGTWMERGWAWLSQFTCQLCHLPGQGFRASD